MTTGKFILISVLFIVFVLSATPYLRRVKSGACTAPAPASLSAINPPLAQLARLTAVDGAAGDRFSWSVAVSGDTVVVGAVEDDIGADGDQGSAQVFVRSGGVWSFKQKLTAQDGAADDRFGSSVAISGDTVVSGAPSDDSGKNVDQGAAYVFVRSGGIWSFQQMLTAKNLQKEFFSPG
jgi:hypothetical protein